MSLEQTLDGIRDQLERIADYLQPQTVTAVHGPTTGFDVTPTPVEAAKRPRGRPAKITPAEKAAATPAEIVEKAPPPEAKKVDDFLDEPKAVETKKPATLEDVRAALLTYAKGKHNGNAEKARELMASVSPGATRLAAAPNVPDGDKGVLPKDKYQAVIDAALVA